MARGAFSDIGRGWVVGVGVALVAAVAVLVAGLIVSSHRGAPISQADLDSLNAAASAADASDAAAAAAAAPKPVVFLGDSYSAGTGATAPDRRWTDLVALANNWASENDAFGSTGYVTETSGDLAQRGCGADTCPNYDQALTAAAQTAPNIVIVSGGRNDVPAIDDNYAQSVAAFFQDVKAKYPTAIIIATSPLWDDDQAPDGLAEVASAVQEGVTAAGGTYLDIGQPLNGRPDLVSEDGVHPNDAGHQAIAEAFDAALVAAGVAA